MSLYRQHCIYSGGQADVVFQSPVFTDYLISRAEATLGSIDKVKKGHADYLGNMRGESNVLCVYFGMIPLI